MKTLTRAYKCEFCKKLYTTAGYCKQHEISCKRNPANYRICLHCEHLEKVSYTIYHDGWNGETEEIIKILHCETLDIYLYPPSVEHKGNALDLGDDINEPMRKECKDAKLEP
jgi:hypothetical protein